MRSISNFNKQDAFTLIELMVSIAIIAVLSGIILFSVTQYINKSKDSNIAANLVVLITAGEVYYNGNSNSYSGFCDPAGNGSVFKNAIIQMPKNSSATPYPNYCYGGDPNNPATWTSTSNPAGVCCYIKSTNDAWVACAREFTTPSAIYCVDSRGVKREVTSSNCNFASSTFQCP